MDKKYLSLGLAAAVLVALFAMALHDPLRFPVINRVVTAVITPLRRQVLPLAAGLMIPERL